MLNRITIQGRVVKKPEMRVTQSGKPVASFTLAVERDYVAQGQDRETDFLDVVAWNQKAEVAGKYLDKGSMAVVDGRLQIRTWTDKEGNKRRNAEILADQIYFCGSRQSDGAAKISGAEGSPASDVPDGFTMLDENADDLPF
jgi:single-strand DNA-binding protein